MPVYHYVFCRLTLILAIFAGLLASTASAEERPSYRIGIVPQFDSRRIIATWHPIADEIERLSGVKLEIEPSPSIPMFEKEFLEGRFDFAYMNPYHLLKASEAQGYRPLVRDIGRELYGILVVQRDSPIQDVSQLQGKTIAFPAPNALGASLLIRAELQGARQIAIQPKYVKSHTSVYLNVVTGIAVAGGGVQKTLNQQAAEVREQLRVIYRTEGVPPHPVAVHPRVPVEVAERLQHAFLTLGESESGRELLAQIPMKQVGVTTLADYQPLMQLGLESYYVAE